MTLWINYKRLCSALIWNQKQNRISRKTVGKDVNDGELGLPDLKNYLLSLKLFWIRKLQNTNHKWKTIFLANYPSADNFKHLGPNFASEIIKHNSFWKHVFNACKLLYYMIQPGNSNELITEPIFYNERIKVGNKMVTCYRNWFEKNVHCIADLLGPTGITLTFAEIKIKYYVSIDFVSYYGLVLSVKKYI